MDSHPRNSGFPSDKSQISKVFLKATKGGFDKKEQLNRLATAVAEHKPLVDVSNSGVKPNHSATVGPDDPVAELTDTQPVDETTESSNDSQDLVDEELDFRDHCRRMFSKFGVEETKMLWSIELHRVTPDKQSKKRKLNK